VGLIFNPLSGCSVNGAADIVRDGSRQQIAGTVAVAALIGWVLGRRF
jgi:hypothetical protein